MFNLASHHFYFILFVRIKPLGLPFAFLMEAHSSVMGSYSCYLRNYSKLRIYKQPFLDQELKRMVCLNWVVWGWGTHFHGRFFVHMTGASAVLGFSACIHIMYRSLGPFHRIITILTLCISSKTQ